MDTCRPKTKDRRPDGGAFNSGMIDESGVWVKILKEDTERERKCVWNDQPTLTTAERCKHALSQRDPFSKKARRRVELHFILMSS